MAKYNYTPYSTYQLYLSLLAPTRDNIITYCASTRLWAWEKSIRFCTPYSQGMANFGPPMYAHTVRFGATKFGMHDTSSMKCKGSYVFPMGGGRYSDKRYSDISKWVMQWVRARVRIRVRVRFRLRLVLVAPFQKHLSE